MTMTVVDLIVIATHSVTHTQRKRTTLCSLPWQLPCSQSSLPAKCICCATRPLLLPNPWRRRRTLMPSKPLLMAGKSRRSFNRFDCSSCSFNWSLLLFVHDCRVFPTPRIGQSRFQFFEPTVSELMLCCATYLPCHVLSGQARVGPGTEDARVEAVGVVGRAGMVLILVVYRCFFLLSLTHYWAHSSEPYAAHADITFSCSVSLDAASRRTVEVAMIGRTL